MLDAPGWRWLCANLQELWAWERETSMHDVIGWPRADGTYEFNCYSLYQSYSSGLPYVLADGRCYDFGCIGNAERLMPGMIVELCCNRHYDIWVGFPWTMQTMRLWGERLGFVYSCVFDERDDRWDAIILCNMQGHGFDMTYPVWGMVRYSIQRIDWYCQQFRGVEPFQRPYKVPGDITQGSLEMRLRSFMSYLRNLDEDTDSDAESLADSDNAAEVNIGIAPSQEFLDAVLLPAPVELRDKKGV